MTAFITILLRISISMRVGKYEVKERSPFCSAGESNCERISVGTYKEIITETMKTRYENRWIIKGFSAESEGCGLFIVHIVTNYIYVNCNCWWCWVMLNSPANYMDCVRGSTDTGWIVGMNCFVLVYIYTWCIVDALECKWIAWINSLFYQYLMRSC